MPSVYPRSDSPFWWISFKGFDGKRWSQASNFRRNAGEDRNGALLQALRLERQHARVVAGELSVEELYAAERGRVDVTALLDEFLDGVRSPAQRAECRGAVRGFLEFCGVRIAAEFGAPSIQTKLERFLKHHERRGLQIESVNKKLWHVQRFSDWLETRGYIMSDKAAKVDALQQCGEFVSKIEHRAFSVAEADLLTLHEEPNLFNRVQGSAVPPLHRVYYRTCLWTGLRGEEAILLERRDLDFQAATIRFRAEITKNGLGCTLPMAPSLAAVLRDEFAMVHPGRRLFADISANRGERLKMLRADMAAVGIRDPLLNMRSPRKTFCSWLEAAGVELGLRMKMQRRIGGDSAERETNWTYSDLVTVMPTIEQVWPRVESWHRSALKSTRAAKEA